MTDWDRANLSDWLNLIVVRVGFMNESACWSRRIGDNRQKWKKNILNSLEYSPLFFCFCWCFVNSDVEFSQLSSTRFRSQSHVHSLWESSMYCDLLRCPISIISGTFSMWIPRFWSKISIDCRWRKRKLPAACHAVRDGGGMEMKWEGEGERKRKEEKGRKRKRERERVNQVAVRWGCVQVFWKLNYLH